MNLYSKRFLTIGFNFQVPKHYRPLLSLKMLEKQKKSGGIIKDESMVTGELAGKPPLSAWKADYRYFPHVPFTPKQNNHSLV